MGYSIVRETSFWGSGEKVSINEGTMPVDAKGKEDLFTVQKRFGIRTNELIDCE